MLTAICPSVKQSYNNPYLFHLCSMQRLSILSFFIDIYEKFCNEIPSKGYLAPAAKISLIVYTLNQSQKVLQNVYNFADLTRMLYDLIFVCLLVHALKKRFTLIQHSAC